MVQQYQLHDNYDIEAISFRDNHGWPVDISIRDNRMITGYQLSWITLFQRKVINICDNVLARIYHLS